MVDIVVIGAMVLVVVLLIWFIASGACSGGGSGMAALTAFHEFLPKDKQHAVEMIVEQRAGKRLEEQSSSAPFPPGGHPEGSNHTGAAAETGARGGEATPPTRL